MARDGTPPAPLPARIHPMAATPIELRIYNGGMRWLLQSHAEIEVWAGPRLVGTLSGAAVTRIVEHHLASAALAAAVQAELVGLAPTRRMPPTRAGIIPPAQRAELRRKRRTRA